MTQEVAAGIEEDEAMLTDPGSEADGDASMDAEYSPPIVSKELHSLMRGSHIAPVEEAQTHTLAINSDDSGFSSEDEYTDEHTQWLQRVRKDLVLGRMTEVVRLKKDKLVELWEGYVRQINAADIELEELLEIPYQGRVTKPVAGGSGKRMHKELDSCMGKDKREVAMMDESTLAAGLVVLARALFEREKGIKHLYGKPAMLGA